MAFHLSCLWLKAFKTAEAATLLGTSWPLEIAGDKDNPLRQVLALSAPDDRTLILDSTSNISLEFAAKLCEGLEVEGLWYELVETSLCWRVCRLAGGIVVDDIVRPETRSDGGFPDYGDAAQDLWEFLGSERIPEALRLARIRDFEGAEGKPNSAIWTRNSIGEAVKGQLVRLQLRDPEGPPHAPIEFSAAIVDTKRGMDMFVLEGKPDPAGLRRVLKAFARIARRKQVGGWRWTPMPKFITASFRTGAPEKAGQESKAVELALKEEFDRAGGAARYGFEM